MNGWYLNIDALKSVNQIVREMLESDIKSVFDELIRTEHSITEDADFEVIEPKQIPEKINKDDR